MQPRAAALPYKIMHGLWGLWQMMFTKYIIVVDDDVDVHNTSEVRFKFHKAEDQPPSIICVGCEQRVPLWDAMEQCFASPEIAALVIK